MKNMRSILTAAIAVAVLGFMSATVADERGRDRETKAADTASTPEATSISTTQLNLQPHPFGVMVSGANAAEKIRRAQLLGTRYYRPMAIFLQKWNGRDEECDVAVAAGLGLVLTVRNSSEPGKPAEPVSDVPAFQETLGSVLDRYRLAVLVVENEENSKLFYTGTPQQYHRELAAAAAVAHARGIKITNGGLVSDLVAMLVAADLEEQGDMAAADDYLNRTISDHRWRKMRGTARWNEMIAKGKALVSGYKIAGADYVNFHWYNTDPSTMAAAVDYLKKATGLSVMANEMGQQKSTDPREVTGMMQNAVNLGLPIAVWFSIDIHSHAEARGFFNNDGSLRPNGEAFRDFLIKRYGRKADGM